jgi:hypothetical protein
MRLTAAFVLAAGLFATAALSAVGTSDWLAGLLATAALACVLLALVPFWPRRPTRERGRHLDGGR